MTFQNKNYSNENDIDGLVEIANVFEQIDKQIMSLHKCSSDDFLMLNSNLKTIYKKAKSITHNIEQGISVQVGQDYNQLLLNLFKIYQNISSVFQEFNNEKEKVSEEMQNVFKIFGMLALPEKNFKQNIMTIKFLIANLVLNTTCFENSSNKEVNELANSIDLKINNLKNSFPHFEEKINIIQNSLRDTKEINQTIDIQLKKTIDTVLKSVRDCISQLMESNKSVQIQSPKVKDAINESYKKVGKVITNLQYHDIIRQKMEHIQDIQKEIVNEVATINQSDIKAGKQFFFKKISDIAELQAAQLVYTNKEYQFAIETIIANLKEINHDIITINTIGKQIVGITQLKDQLSLLTQKQFEVIFLEVENLLHKCYSIFNNIFKVKDEIIKYFSTSFKEFKNKIELDINALSKLSTNISNIELKASILQIDDVFKDVEMNYNSINDYLNQIQNLLNSIVKCKENCSFILNEDKINAFKVDSNRTLNEIFSNHQQIFNMQSSNINMIENIGNEIKQSVESIRYYEFFDKSIEKIIVQLQSINEILRITDKDIKINEFNLKEIKEKYTMKSEHEIHENIVSKSFDKNKINMNDANNVEFF